MCGIVGLHLRSETFEDRLGELLVPMLDCMETRGPDSAGLSIYSGGVPEGRYRYSVRFPETEPEDVAPTCDGVAESLARALGAPVDVERVRPDGALMVAPADQPAFAEAAEALETPVVVMGFGRHLELVKDTGRPIEVCEHYEVAKRSGYQAVGHTRMATESAVTTDHSHPFAPNADLSLVHNGSFSNHATVRRGLAQKGIECVTDNDSEVAARLIGYELDQGASLSGALKQVGNVMDGFYTLLVASGQEFAVVRDSFACKPLVVAETDDYVAVTSEYVAMAGLPGIDNARVFEPMPGEIHAWGR